MDIDKLEAGRELDALVAKEVMDWHQEYVRRITGEMDPMWNEPEYLVPPGKDEVERVPAYSTDIVAAWEARTKIVDSTGAAMELTDYGGPKDVFERYCCVFVKERPKSAGLTEWGAEGWANTAPLAISRAVLKAVDAGIKRATV